MLARTISRRRPTPRANTVRPYALLPIGPVGRGLTPPGRRAITATLLLIANFKIIRRGRRPRRPVQPRKTTQLPGGVKTHPYEPTQKPSPKKLQRRTIPRGVEDAAPYTQPYKGCRGEHCSPARVSRRSPPTHQKFWPRRGQTERGKKALRKAQHSCAF